MTGERIRELRKKHRYSQKQLAEMIGVAQTAVSAWETGARGITLDVLMHVATALGEPLSALLPEEVSQHTKEKLDSVKQLDELPRGELFSGEMLDLQLKLEFEIGEHLEQAQKECDALMKKRLERIPDSVLLKTICDVFRGVNKIGKFELYMKALEIDENVMRRYKDEGD